MSRRKIKAGSTSQILPLFIQDTSSSTGAGLGSLVYNTASLAAKYRRQGDSSWTAITLVTATAGTFTSGGFIADGGSVTGGYELGLPNAMLAAGATWAQLQIYGAANMLAVLVEFELDAVDYQDATRFGLAAMPNVASGSAGGLIVQGTGTTGLDVSSGKVLLQATQTGVTIPTVTTVTNQLTAAQIATGVWRDTTAGDFTVASSIGKSLYTSGNAPGAASGIALVGSNMGTITGGTITTVSDKTGYSLSASGLAAVTAWTVNVTGSLSGSVGSVSGAVGSVTGNVGGNVVGSVGSVSGAVGSVTGNVGGNVTGSVGSIATGGIVAGSFALDSITSTALAASAVSEIQSGLSTYAGGDTAGTTTLLSRLSATRAGYIDNLSGGAVALASGVTVASMATDAISALSVSAGAVTKIQSGLSTYAGGDTSGTTTLLSRITATRAGYIDNLSGGAVMLASSYSAPPSAATISTQVTSDLATSHGSGTWTTATGFSTLDAVGVRNAVGLAAANLDTQLDALPTAAENTTAVWAAATRSLTDKAGFSLATAPPTADENAAALLDLASAIESGLTVRQAMRLIVAAEAGKVSGAGGTTVTIRDVADTKNRIVATVDSSGNRTSLTRDLS